MKCARYVVGNEGRMGGGEKDGDGFRVLRAVIDAGDNAGFVPIHRME